MSVVKINVLQVPEGRGDMLEQRFAARARDVETVDGFESFDLLRPTEGTDRYLVVTKWRDDAAFQAWVNSEAFGSGHGHGAQGQAPRDSAPAAGAPADSAPAAGGPPAGGPAASGSELWGFEVVTSAAGQRA